MTNTKTKNKISDTVGKIPPQALDLEAAVLGALMIEKDAYFTIANIIDTASFYSEANQKIFEVIKHIATQHKPVDMLVVTQELMNRNVIDEIGGPVYVAKLTSHIASAAHIDYHARIIAQKYMQRELIRVANEIQTNAYDDAADVDDLIHFADKSINEVMTSIGAAVDSGASQRDVIAEACKEIEQDCINTSKGIITGIPTGFQSLDSIIGGWKPGTLTIFASRPGIGKTSLALHFAKVAALNRKWVNFFSMEMSRTDLVKILISGETGINRTKIRDGKLDESDWNLIHKSLGMLERLPIIWNDRAGITVSQIKAAIRKNKKAGKCDLVVIDYLQLVAPTDRKVIREQQIAEISRVLKEITLNENVPIICLSQLNREAEDEQPKPSHLRESGAIEQDADQIIFPWRPGYNAATADGLTIPETEIKILIKKNRRGKRGEFKIFANEEMTRFGESEFDLNTPPF